MVAAGESNSFLLDMFRGTGMVYWADVSLLVSIDYFYANGLLIAGRSGSSVGYY